MKPLMVQTTKASLMDAICTSDKMSDGKIDKATLRWNKIQEYLKTQNLEFPQMIWMHYQLRSSSL